MASGFSSKFLPANQFTITTFWMTTGRLSRKKLAYFSYSDNSHWLLCLRFSKYGPSFMIFRQIHGMRVSPQQNQPTIILYLAPFLITVRLLSILFNNKDRLCGGCCQPCWAHTSRRYFIFHFASCPSDIAWPIQPPNVRKNGCKRNTFTSFVCIIKYTRDIL